MEDASERTETVQTAGATGMGELEKVAQLDKSFTEALAHISRTELSPATLHEIFSTFEVQAQKAREKMAEDMQTAVMMRDEIAREYEQNWRLSDNQRVVGALVDRLLESHLCYMQFAADSHKINLLSDAIIKKLLDYRKDGGEFKERDAVLKLVDSIGRQLKELQSIIGVKK